MSWAAHNPELSVATVITRAGVPRGWLWKHAVKRTGGVVCPSGADDGRRLLSTLLRQRRNGRQKT